MAILVGTSDNPLSLREVAAISQTLADDISRLVLRTRGFSVAEYFSLDGAYFVEYVDGCLQVLPIPDAFHQALAFVLSNMLVEFSRPDPLARTKLAPFRVQLNENEYREPDVCFMLGSNARRRQEEFWVGADLVIEVISESNRRHDYETKRREYAEAGIPEYWILDPAQRLVRVLTLRDAQYITHGDFGAGHTATSVLLNEFRVVVADLFAQAAAQA